MAKNTNAGLEYYQGENGEWFWRLRSQNGNIVGGPTEGYRRISGAKKGFEALRAAVLAMDAPQAVKPPRKARTVKAAIASAKESLVDVLNNQEPAP